MPNITQHNNCFSTSPQLSITEVAEIAALGYKTIINNRPDGEGGPEQPTSAQIEQAAQAHGLHYIYLPVISGSMTDDNVQQMAGLLADVPQPVLAFCRSGTRSTNLYNRAKDLPPPSPSAPVAASHDSPHILSTKRNDIVIVGGGAAGIGVAASLLKRQPSLNITIIEPADSHYYQPAWTLVGGGEFDQLATRRDMAEVIPPGVHWIKAAVCGFDPANNRVHIDSNDPTHNTVEYEYLIVAPGIQLNWNAIPGLVESLGKNGVTSNYHFEHAPYTWRLTQELRSGRAIFTQPPMPIKCAGAPQKAMYLACFEWEKRGVLKDMSVEFDNAGAVLFGVAAYVPALMEYVKRYDATLNFNTNLVEVDGPSHKAWFAAKDAEGNVTRIERSFDMLHAVPPQSAPDFVKASPIANADGWVEVDQFSLQHTRYPNIFGLGDACSSPNAKTAGAARKQVVVVAENLLALRGGRPFPLRYDGYGSCPLTVEKGKIVLAEFGFGGKLLPTFPLDPTVARRTAWILKKDILPHVYWDMMLKGREWLARPVE